MLFGFACVSYAAEREMSGAEKLKIIYCIK